MKERATFVEDIWESSQFFFDSPTEYDEKTHRKKWKEHTPDILKKVTELFVGMSDFSAENVEKEFKSLLEENEWGLGMVLPTFRLAVTGKGMGPSMFKISELLGKDEVVERIETAIQKLS